MRDSEYLSKRAAATTETIREFSPRSFVWGESDCVSMVIYHAEQIGRGDIIPEFEPYKTPKSALRRLKQMGFSSLADMMDSLFDRIPVNSAINGDFVLLAGDTDGLDALGIKAGAFVFGYHQDDPHPKVCIFSETIGAWRG